MSNPAPAPTAAGAKPGELPGALVLGGAHGGLAIARSLGRRGITVDTLSDHPLVGLSRYVRRRFAWSDPGRPDALSRLIGLAHQEKLEGATLFPGGDAEVRFVAQNHAALAAIFRLTTPPWSALERAVDKRLMQRHAATIGVDTPVVIEPHDRGELETMPCRFPVVLKPTERTADNAFTLAKAWRADDRASLLARYDEAAALVGADHVIIQELIPGGGEAQFSYAAVYDRGLAIAELVACRRRQYPVEFGYTSTFVTTAAAPDVLDAGRRFLGSLDYTGIAEVEFKRDPRDGRAKLLDVNARIWTWAALGAAAGVDFPHALWRLAQGQAVGEAASPVTAQRDAAWMHSSRDAVVAIHEMLRGRLTPAAYLLALRTPLVFAAFTLDDPLPGIVELPLALWRGATHRLPIVMRDFWRYAVLGDRPACCKPESEPAPLTRAPDSPYSPSGFRHKRLADPAD
jgi:predicted ATP-grasp superfamily ATP-dependent carboligase